MRGKDLCYRICMKLIGAKRATAYGSMGNRHALIRPGGIEYKTQAP